MRYFIVEIIYKAPREHIEAVRPQHREFLQIGYKSGNLLVSGPKSSGEGGIVVAKDDSEEKIRSFFENDPYFLKGIADYRFIEFKPLSRQDLLNGWISEE